MDYDSWTVGIEPETVPCTNFPPLYVFIKLELSIYNCWVPGMGTDSWNPWLRTPGKIERNLFAAASALGLPPSRQQMNIKNQTCNGAEDYHDQLQYKKI